MSRLARLSLAALATATIACASRGSGTPANATRFERNIGTGTAPDVMEIAPRIMRQYRFEVYREQSSPTIYIETRWQDRAPFLDEEQIGITRAQNRLIVRGNTHGTTPQGPLYRVDLTVENRVQVGGRSDWTDAHATDQYVAWADRITEDFKRELSIGVRRFR